MRLVNTNNVDLLSLDGLLAGQRRPRPAAISEQKLQQLGLHFDAAEMWLPDQVQPLDVQRLHAGLSVRAKSIWPDCQVVNACESTNASLLEQGLESVGQALTTEYQWGGRGRRGRDWLSPVARNIALSVAWVQPGSLAELSGLSLAVGVACTDVLHTLGVDRAAIKWPNDLIVLNSEAADTGAAYSKLGGILVELQSFGDRTLAVVGIGVNFAAAPLLRPHVDQDLADVAELCPALDRTTLLIGLLNALADYLANFAETGFAPLVPVWNELHAFTGKTVSVGDPNDPQKATQGRVLGVATSGELRLATARGEVLIGAGEVSLRPGAPNLSRTV